MFGEVRGEKIILSTINYCLFLREMKKHLYSSLYLLAHRAEA